MELLLTVITFGLIISLIISPIAIRIGLKRRGVKKYRFLIYLTFGVIFTSIITLTFGWWSDASNGMLLSHYGYNFNAINDTERFANVSAENLERVKRLEISMTGIGWPLKAIMTFAMYCPYILIIYLVAYLIQKTIKSTVRREIS